MCYNPVTKKKYVSRLLPIGTVVPCGKCFECLQKRRAEWSFRLKEELKVSETAYFITLTYDEDHLILTESGNPTLAKKDLQDYFKRVRTENPKLRYYAVGEYGGKTHRPHYHAIVFNSDSVSLVSKWGTRKFKNSEIFGNVRLDRVTEARIHYVTGYLIGKKGVPKYSTGIAESYGIDKNTGEVWLTDDMQGHFAIMSKGIGKNYCINEKYHKENLTIKTNQNGMVGSLPRYYRDKFFNTKEKLIIKKEREKYYADQLKNYDVKAEHRKKKGKFRQIINALESKHL